MRPSQPIVIAGGGIAGLGLALALARAGIASHVLERREQFSEAGAGIQLGPNGVLALEALGVLDALLPHAGRPSEIRVFKGRSGALLQRLPLGDWIEARHGAPYLVAHRRDLQAALLARTRVDPLITITTAFYATRFESNTGVVHVFAADGRRATGAALIGADGVFSTIRRQIAPDAAPRFAGRTAARTVIPAEAAIAPLFTDATGVWLARKAHVVHYPIRAGREIAVVVIREEDWHDEGWNAPLAFADLDEALQPFSPSLRNALSKAPEWRRWALFDAPPLERWRDGSARVVLIGDAAHPMLPFLAQGGSLALEDAVVLAGLIATFDGDLDLAGRCFQGQRIERTVAIAKQSRQNEWIYHLGGAAAAVRNLGLRLLPPERVMLRYDWIYGWRSK